MPCVRRTWRRAMRAPIALACAATAALVLAAPAAAHGEYRWIAELYGQAPSFDADFKGCCGRQDCFPVAATFTRRGGVPGWEIHDRFGGFVPDRDARPSHDPEGRHWRCYVMRRDQALGLVPDRPRSSDGKPCFFPSRGDF